MKEALDDAQQELKRVDHLFHVSLKYTRTVDMIRHTIDRLISAFDFGIEALLRHAKEKKMTDEIPTNTGLRCDLIKEKFSDNEELIEYINFYLTLRKIIRAEYTKREEFRRHVTMTATINKGELIEVDIDLLKEYYEKTRNFIYFVRTLIFGEEEII